MNGRESCSSLRSMEILSPEPPRDLNIPVYGSSDEDGVKSCGDKKSKNSKKKKNSESSYQDEKLTRGLGIKLSLYKESSKAHSSENTVERPDIVGVASTPV